MNQLRPVYPASSKILNNRIKKFEPDCNALEIGQSFSVGMDEMKFATIRAQVSVIGKKLGKKFRVVLHEEHKIYEVARIA